MTPSPRNKALAPFARLIGRWKLSARHPMFPGEQFHGEASFEWLDDGAFLIWHSKIDDARFPVGIAVIGGDDERDEYFMLYFDDRGVSRQYDLAVEGNTISWSRNTPTFSQRFTWTIADDASAFVTRGQMSRNGGPWEGDLEAECTRF
jgi:hypothetical protein